MEPVGTAAPAPTPGTPATATPAATPVLTAGAVVDVRVVRALTAGRFLVALGNTEFVANSETELKPGSQVRLSVASASPDGVVLRLAEPVTTAISAAPERQAALRLPATPAAAAVLAAFEEAGAPLDPPRLQAAVRAASLPDAPKLTAQAHALLARAALPATPALIGVALRAAENRLPDVAAEMGGTRAAATPAPAARTDVPGQTVRQVPGQTARQEPRPALPITLPSADDGAPAIRRIFALAGVHPAMPAGVVPKAETTKADVVQRASARVETPSLQPMPSLAKPAVPPSTAPPARPTAIADPGRPPADEPELVGPRPPARPAPLGATTSSSSQKINPQPAPNLGATSSSSSQAVNQGPAPPPAATSPSPSQVITAPNLGATSSSSSQAINQQPAPPVIPAPPLGATSSSSSPQPAPAPATTPASPSLQPAPATTLANPSPQPAPATTPSNPSPQPAPAPAATPSSSSPNPPEQPQPTAPKPPPATPQAVPRPNLIREIVRLITEPAKPTSDASTADPEPTQDAPARPVPTHTAPAPAPAASATRPLVSAPAPPPPDNPAAPAPAPPPPTGFDETVTRTVREHLAEQVFKPKDLADYDRVVPLPLSTAQVTTPARLAVATRSTGGGAQATFVRVDAELTRLGPVSVRLSGVNSGGPLAITLIAKPGPGAILAEGLPALVEDLRALGIDAAVRVVADG